MSGLRVRLGQELATLRHTVTRYAITLVAFEAQCRGGRFRSSFYTAGRWVEPAELPAYPLSAPQRRLAALLTGPCRQQSLF